jgi:allantoate deiminase
MPVSVDRIRADIEAIGRFTATPGAGADRPTFSTPWREAVDYVVAQAKTAGCKVRTDAAGNVHARPESIPWETPLWLSGSHLDSVPHGGEFDGVTGVVVPLEILRAAREDDAPPPPLELIIFAEEEGTTFGLGMLGSRAWVGDLSAKELKHVRNAAGENYLEAGAPHGVRESMLLEDRFEPRHYLGLIEAHVEQGPGMWNRGERVAVVTAIAGRRQYRCSITGVAHHAGSTSMHDRKDALVAASTCVLQLEGVANGLSGGASGGAGAVVTVGRMHVKPNAINVIPAHVDFTIDFRTPSNETLAAGDEKIRQVLRQVCDRRGVSCTIEPTENAPAVEMDLHVCARLQRSAKRLDVPVSAAVSGALHDAAILAPRLPTAMVFVASKDGVSHNPAEFSRVEDISLAAQLVQGAIQEQSS